MNLIITDTSVFFDIIAIKALPEFFQLDFNICTTDFVEKEILQSDQKEQINYFISLKKLTVISFSAKEMEEIEQFKTKRKFSGITDKSVLWKAYNLKCPLLTGDKKLRNEAEEQGIEVHGSIWVILQFIDNKIITNAKGRDLFELLKLVNNSLPHDEIDKIILLLK